MISATRLRDVVQDRRAPSMQELLNCWAVEGDVLVGVDLQYTRLLRLQCPELLMAAAAEGEQHALAIGRLLDALPENCTAQLLVRVRWDAGKRLEEFAAAKRPGSEMVSFLTSARVDFLKKMPFKRVDHLLALTTHPEKTDLSRMRHGLLMTRVPAESADLAGGHAARLQGLAAIANNVQDSLRAAKVAFDPMTGDDVRSYLYERLNPATSRLLPVPSPRPKLTLRSQLALNACESAFDTVTLDGHHHRAVNLLLRPEMLDGRTMANLIDDIPGDFDLAITIHSLNQETGQRGVESTSTTAAVLGGLSLFTRYHEAELKSQDADAMLQHVKSTSQKIYLLSAHVVLRDVDRRELTTHHDQAVAAFRRLNDSVAIVDDMHHLSLFLASLPGHSHLNPRVHIVHTEAAARFLTMSATWNGCANPQFLTPADDGKLLGVDFFSPDLPVKHGLVLGVSGEGKSVLMNALLTSFYAGGEDNQVVVIDDGGSYKRLCGLLGGQYLEPKLDGEYSFNPFLAKEHAINENGELEADFISFITLLIKLMLRIDAMSNNQMSIIEKAVVETYAQVQDETPRLGHFREALKTLKNRRADIDEKDSAVAQDMARNLEYWTDGPYSRLLNRPSSFKASSRFVVFDLHEMTQEELKPVMLLIIKSVIHPKLADKGLRKLIALDEVWKFLSDKAGADLVKEWYKAGRKFNAAVLVATQSAEDLLRSAAAEAIIHNSTVQWILNLGGGYENLAGLKLSEDEIEAVKALGKNVNRKQYRKVFLRFGNHSGVIRNQLSPIEYWLYTTDPNDFNREARAKKAHPEWSAVELLTALAQEKV